MHELQGLAIDVRLLDENNNEVDINTDDDDEGIITVEAHEHTEEEQEVPASEQLENDLEDDLNNGGFSIVDEEQEA